MCTLSHSANSLLVDTWFDRCHQTPHLHGVNPGSCKLRLILQRPHPLSLGLGIRDPSADMRLYSGFLYW